MRHVWQNELRRQSRIQETWIDDINAVSAEESLEISLGRKMLVSEVRAAVDSMPVAWREIVVMRDVEEFSYTEIAAILGCPIGTVMSRLARARAALRQRLTGRVPASREVTP